jgi:hypothetical protein
VLSPLMVPCTTFSRDDNTSWTFFPYLALSVEVVSGLRRSSIYVDSSKGGMPWRVASLLPAHYHIAQWLWRRAPSTMKR